MSKRHVSQAEIDAIWRCKDEGKGLQQTADACRVSPDLVRTVYRENRRFARNCQGAAYFNAIVQAMEMMDQGVSAREAALKTGLQISDAITRHKARTGIKKVAAVREVEGAMSRPVGVTAAHETGDWYEQNQESFVRGMLLALPEMQVVYEANVRSETSRYRRANRPSSSAAQSQRSV